MILLTVMSTFEISLAFWEFIIGTNSALIKNVKVNFLLNLNKYQI